MDMREKLKDALRAYDRIEPADDAWERLKASAWTRSVRFGRGRGLLIGAIVVLAMGTIIGLRLTSDREGRVRAVTPAIGPTASSSPTATSSPSPTTSPTPSPSPSPTGDKIHYVSADGVWEILYPKTWFGPSTAEIGWSLTNYNGSPSSVTLPIEVKFNIYGNSANLSLDDLLASMCGSGPQRQILECKKVTINGRLWDWVLAYSTEEGPVTYLGARTIAGGKIYHATGYIDASSGQAPALDQIRAVFSSFVLNT